MPGASLLALAGVLEALQAANGLQPEARYEVQLLSLDGAPAACCGQVLSPQAWAAALPLLAPEQAWDLLLVFSGESLPADAALLLALQAQAAAGVALAGVDGGSALLAEAGLLSGQRATVNGAWIDALQEDWPEVVWSDKVWEMNAEASRMSCAGGSASLDLMVAWLGRRHGERFAQDLTLALGLEFILRHLERFNDRIAAESPGLADEAGQSPFWDAVGRRFFDMDYPQAEAVTGGRSKSFIADLIPQSPIYVPLLPEAAQFAIGQLHPVGELPFSILQDEGFDADSYIDIFDGGPTVEASLHLLRSVRHARELAVQADAMALGQPVWHLAVNSARPGFRAVLAELPPAAQALAPGHEAVQRLGLSEGQSLWGTPLQPEALERSRS